MPFDPFVTQYSVGLTTGLARFSLPWLGITVPSPSQTPKSNPKCTTLLASLSPNAFACSHGERRPSGALRQKLRKVSWSMALRLERVDGRAAAGAEVLKMDAATPNNDDCFE